jgi:penicillin-binding protein 1A
MFGLGRHDPDPVPVLPGDAVAIDQDIAATPPPSRWRWMRHALVAALLLFMAAIAWLAVTAPLSRSLEPVAPPRITLVSADGKPIARRGAIIDKPVVIADLPAHVPAAFLAIEDRRFYSHFGIDPRGIARAAWRNTLAGGVREGGSTITQQLAKVAFLQSDRTAGRKAQEALIAFWLEAWLTKDEILARYLSNVYFGDNVYGLRAASLHYFNRRPEKLTLSQAAMLAGLLKAPSRLAPTVNLKGARERGDIVLAAMARHGFITQDEADAARPASIDVRPVRSLPTGTYFADWVLPEARDRAGAVYAEQTIETTLDADIQRMAERAIRRAGLGGAQVALVAMRPDGRVVAMIGGKDYADSSFNRATQARRQPGSTFKLFVYLAALRAGMDPDTLVDDSPLTIGDWSPRNNGERYRGKITLKQAFASSSNVAAVRLAEAVGRDEVIRAARDLGVTSPLGTEPSLALGTSGMTLLELTSAYAAVAGNSYPVRARGLPLLEQSWFDRLRDRKRSFDEDTTLSMLMDLLWAAANEGTGRSAALREATYGKTGTTQDNRDAIFVGFAGDLVTGIWVGNDDDTPLKGVAGGGLPARIWRDFMAQAIDSRPRNSRAAQVVAPEPEVETGNNMMLSSEIGGVGISVELGPDEIILSADPPPAPDGPAAPIEVRIAPPPPRPAEESVP